MQTNDKPEIAFMEKFAHGESFEGDIEAMVRVISDVQMETIESIGVGLAGTVNEEGTGLIKAPNMRLWVDKNIVHLFSHAFHVPVFIYNDAVAGAWSEYGYGSFDKTCFYLVWGTGIGGAMWDVNANSIINVEPGHEVKVWDEDRRKNVLWESAGGGKALKQRRWNLGKSDLSKDEAVMKQMSEGILELRRVYGFNKLIINGGVVINRKDWFGNLQTRLAESIPPMIMRMAIYQDNAGIYGGYYYQDRLLKPDED